MSNLILGRLEEELDETTRFECMVGGLPVVRHWPFQYKAPFSPVDVLEEYTRPARLRRNGRTRVVPALSDVEMLDLPEVGALEAFNTDGLRTLLKTCETPNMVEKTLRYPGHAEWMKGLRASGFFRSEAMDVDGDTVVPLKLTGKLLEEAWAFDEDEEDLTVMRLVVDGVRDGKEERHSFHLLDRYDSETGTSSMARTTGYTCTAMVRAVAQGLYREPGVSPLELVGREKKVYDFVMDELKARGVEFQHSVQEVEEG
jgi:saccharopine dehydrogenase-like NADP-dependent oxidoreductase